MRHMLAIMGYVLPAFPLGRGWHLVVIAAYYRNRQVYREDILVPFGILLMPRHLQEAWLEKFPSEATIPCQYCERDDLNVEELLHAFRPRDAEIMAKLQDLNVGQQDLLAAAYAIFTALDPENQERTRGLSLFTRLPGKSGCLKVMAVDQVRLTCLCEHPDGSHPASLIGSD